VKGVAAGQQLWYSGAMARLDKAIAAAIKASGQTPAAIARGANVARSQLSRLLSGERGLSTETAERIANYLRLEIVIRQKRERKDGRHDKG
jgi:transcriptional regulator with XRE-family HTH domain